MSRYSGWLGAKEQQSGDWSRGLFPADRDEAGRTQDLVSVGAPCSLLLAVWP